MTGEAGEDGKDGANRLLFWAMAGKMTELLFEADAAGLLGGLADGLDEAELVGRTGWTPEALASVLEVFHRAGIVAPGGDRPRLAPGVETALPLVAAEARLAAWHRDNGSLARALAGEGGSDPLDAPQPSAVIRGFAEAMGQAARGTALMVRRLARPAADARVLDLGGADGAVAMALAGAWPAATFTVVDRKPLHAPFGQRLGAEPALAARIRFAAHDLRHPQSLAALIGAADVILLLNVLHLLPEAAIDALLGEIRAHARAGCTVVLRELTADGGGDLAPLFLIDWLRCGSCFRDDAGAFARRLVRAWFPAPRELALAGAPDRFFMVEVP